MDNIYKNKSKNEVIELIYDLTLQNTNGRETPEEMYKKGIEACYEELCEGKPGADTASGLHLQNVRRSFKFDYKFGHLSKEGFRHFPILYFAYGTNGFSLCILGATITAKLW